MIVSRKRSCALFVLLAAVFAVLTACSGKADEGQAAVKRKFESGAQKPDVPFQGEIVFQSDADGNNNIYAMTAEGVRKLTENTWNNEYPRFSPDGKRIAFTANPKGNYDIFVMDKDGKNITAVTNSPDDETEPAWFPDGTDLAYTRRDALIKLDLRTGASSRIIPDFPRTHGLSDFSPSAPLVAFTGHRLMGWDVFIGDLEHGKFSALTEGGKSCRPRFSKDGEKIAFVSSKTDGRGDIWIMNPDGSEKTRLTVRDETSDYFPAWSPDNRTIVFSSSVDHSPKKGRWKLLTVDVGSRKVTPLFSGFERAIFPDWH